MKVSKQEVKEIFDFWDSMSNKEWKEFTKHLIKEQQKLNNKKV